MFARTPPPPTLEPVVEYCLGVLTEDVKDCARPVFLLAEPMNASLLLFASLASAG